MSNPAVPFLSDDRRTCYSTVVFFVGWRPVVTLAFSVCLGVCLSALLSVSRTHTTANRTKTNHFGIERDQRAADVAHHQLSEEGRCSSNPGFYDRGWLLIETAATLTHVKYWLKIQGVLHIHACCQTPSRQPRKSRNLVCFPEWSSSGFKPR